ncbi:MAG: hypothetical protein E7012_00900 [Alphaproteobacteria bacterium]|nr:hypothetical protein [Alphaproteobacteria bacterium]
MNNNPLAIAIRNAYIKHVLTKPLVNDAEHACKNTIENILRNKRTYQFEKALNKFLTNSGLPPVPYSSPANDEKDILTFTLQLSGYIRDAQKQLANLQHNYACDIDLIDLYKAAAKYSVECNGKIADSKYIFHEHCDYKFYQVINPTTLSQAQFIETGFEIDPNRPNLFVSMPFHIKSDQAELQKWSTKYLNKILDNQQVFGSQVDVYLAHFPLEQPRGEKFALALETIRNPQNYFEDADMKFVKDNLIKFLGNNIQINNKNQIISSDAFSDETFKQTCKNITILDYCAGGAHSHRWINAFSHLANQIYDKETVKDALKNIFVVSYAFLPIQKENKYSGAHFMSNFADDTMRKEPFIKMFNPVVYEQSKFHKNCHTPAKISIMPDKRNYIIAFNLPEDFAVYNEKNEKVSLPDLENGHHMGAITQPNANSWHNYPLQQFTTVLENASLGKRGLNVFDKRSSVSNYPNINNTFITVKSSKNHM